MQNFSMLADFYEFTMANGYYETGNADRIAFFDLLFRRVPDDGGYAIMAGVGQMIEYLENLRFDSHDIEHLSKKDVFSDGFLR